MSTSRMPGGNAQARSFGTLNALAVNAHMPLAEHEPSPGLPMRLQMLLVRSSYLRQVIVRGRLHRLRPLHILTLQQTFDGQFDHGNLRAELGGQLSNRLADEIRV